MAITASFSPDTGRLVLLRDTAGSCSDQLLRRGGNDRLIWNRGGASDSDIAPVNGFGHDAFTITAAGGQVRVFRAFLDQPRNSDHREHHRQHRRRRRSVEVAKSRIANGE